MTKQEQRLFTVADEPLGEDAYVMVGYVGESEWDHDGYVAVFSTDDEDSDDYCEHRHKTVATASSRNELLACFGECLAALGNESTEQVAAMILSGEDHGNLWSLASEKSLSFLRSLSSPGLQIAAHYLCAAMPFSFRRKLSKNVDREPYLALIPKGFPEHEFVCGWDAAPPHQEEAYAILKRR